ncbi:dynein regulatory complex subunit 4-like [Periophthalmus magnuspinnatus]|uniref:dynein regulatory complex subunit 4-like n=1 Tax=Periophthalmus magnuspinnatus TaxID=409849 RepID=UPI0024364B23|nr:dynein regulatory complex subunit 4-like [Periophthalmus magnuspinnatus]
MPPNALQSPGTRLRGPGTSEQPGPSTETLEKRHGHQPRTRANIPKSGDRPGESRAAATEAPDTTAPKRKSKKTVKKTKPPAVVDALSTEEMNKDQLEEHIVRLREELDREREEKSYFQLERDRVQSLWETGLRDLDRVQTELNQRRREREEAEERHRQEINVYKQKLKHVLSEQHGAVSELKTVQTWTKNQVQNQNSDRELNLVQEKSHMETRLREKEHLREKSLKTLQLKQQVELMELMNDYDRKVRDVEQRFRALSSSLGQEQERRLQQEVQEVEEAAKKKISELKTEQQRLLRATEEHYSNLSTRLEMEHRELTERQVELRAELSRVQKKLTEAQSENLRLKEDLEQAQRLLPDLRRKLEQSLRDKELEKKGREREKHLEKELRALKMENTLLQQAFEKVERERDQLKDAQLLLELEVQRRNGLKEALLQQKLSALSLALHSTQEPVPDSGLR